MGLVLKNLVHDNVYSLLTFQTSQEKDYMKRYATEWLNLRKRSDRNAYVFKTDDDIEAETRAAADKKRADDKIAADKASEKKRKADEEHKKLVYDFAYEHARNLSLGNKIKENSEYTRIGNADLRRRLSQHQPAMLRLLEEVEEPKNEQSY